MARCLKQPSFVNRTAVRLVRLRKVVYRDSVTTEDPPGRARPGHLRPYRQSTEPPSKTWVPTDLVRGLKAHGSRPATGTAGCGGALWYLLTAAVKSGTGQPWLKAGHERLAPGQDCII